MASIISAVKTYLAGYSGLAAGAPVWVDALGPGCSEYAIVPLPGQKVVEEYINGSSLREFPFAFQSMESAADDLARLENIGFFESFSDWLESQTAAKILPNLGSGKTAEGIAATGWGYLFELGESGSGRYQVECKLTYLQDA